MTTATLENFLCEIGATPNSEGAKTQLMYMIELAEKVHLDGLRYALFLAAERGGGSVLPLLVKAVHEKEGLPSSQLEAWGNQPPPSKWGWRELRFKLAKEGGGEGMRYAVASYLAPGFVTPPPHYLGNVHMFHQFVDTIRAWPPLYFDALITAIRTDFPTLSHLLGDSAASATSSGWYPAPSMPLGPMI